MKYLVLAATLAGCTSESAPAASGGSTTPKPATTPVDPWAPGKVIARPGPAWRIVIESHYGPCDPSDKRPCSRSWTATPDGQVKLVEHPNDGSPAIETVTTLTTEQRDRLAAIVAKQEFVDGMARGFPCSSPGREPDASLRLTFDPANERASSQFVLHCTRTPSLPGEVVELIR